MTKISNDTLKSIGFMLQIITLFSNNQICGFEVLFVVVVF